MWTLPDMDEKESSNAEKLNRQGFDDNRSLLFGRKCEVRGLIDKEKSWIAIAMNLKGNF